MGLTSIDSKSPKFSSQGKSSICQSGNGRRSCSLLGTFYFIYISLSRNEWMGEEQPACCRTFLKGRWTTLSHNKINKNFSSDPKWEKGRKSNANGKMGEQQECSCPSYYYGRIYISLMGDERCSSSSFLLHPTVSSFSFLFVLHPFFSSSSEIAWYQYHRCTLLKGIDSMGKCTRVTTHDKKDILVF